MPRERPVRLVVMAKCRRLSVKAPSIVDDEELVGEGLDLGISRFSKRTRRMEESGVDCGDIGGTRPWKTSVARDSRCFGTAG